MSTRASMQAAFYMFTVITFGAFLYGTAAMCGAAFVTSLVAFAISEAC